MQTITPGHEYELEHFEGSDFVEVIQFIHKEEDEEGNLVTIEDGTTNEEVLRMLINRMYFLQGKLPSQSNLLVISCLQDALRELEARTKDREERGVEGTQQP